MDKATYFALQKRFKNLARRWVVPANQGSGHRRARSIIQSPSQEDVEDLASLMMMAYVESDLETRDHLFAAGNEGKLFFHIKNLLGDAAKQISVQLPDVDEDEPAAADIVDEHADPLHILASEEISPSEIYLEQLDEINSLSNQTWIDASGLKESEARALKRRVKKEQVNNLIAAAAKAAGISQRDLSRLKFKYQVA